jgi:hypothetical protein
MRLHQGKESGSNGSASGARHGHPLAGEISLDREGYPSPGRPALRPAARIPSTSA